MKDFLKSLSIRHKLTLLMVIISVTTLSISATLFYKSQVKVLENSAFENIKTQASLIASSVESSIVFSDDEAAKKILSFFKTNPSVEVAAIILPDKTIFAYYNKSKGKIEPIVNLDKEKMIEENSLEVSHKLVSNEYLLAYVYIKSNLDKLKAQRVFFTEVFVSVILFSLIFAYILARIFQKIITNPLDKMVAYVEKMSHTKNYTKRLKLNLTDELGTLVKGFDLMLDAVQDRENELKEHSQHLQAMVDERTEELYEKAHFDSLTNLANRALLLERLNHAVLAAKRKNSRLAVLFMDLDRFKMINDSLGHNIGDELLVAVAGRLIKSGREIDTVARLGGDEFVFLLDEISKPEDAGRIAQRIKESFSKPFHLEKDILYISTSIGISIYPEDGDNSQDLLKNADASMYHSKEIGPGNYTFYRDDINSLSFKHLELENALRNAIVNNEFHLVYQPQVTLNNNKINNVEALLRWHNPILGNVGPDVFIPIAEEIGIINQVGAWVITETCKQLSDWEKYNINDLTVAVNVSASHLLADDLVSHIKNEAARFDIGYEKLEIEITEGVFLEHSVQVIDVLHELQSLGIKISIDDFGTGYSSLRYLKTLPVDTLKLDGMFILDLQNNLASQGIVSSTIILAHSLQLKLVAECVETKDQLEFLKSKNCDLVQGYFLHKPLLAKDIIDVLKA